MPPPLPGRCSSLPNSAGPVSLLDDAEALRRPRPGDAFEVELASAGQPWVGRQSPCRIGTVARRADSAVRGAQIIQLWACSVLALTNGVVAGANVFYHGMAPGCADPARHRFGFFCSARSGRSFFAVVQEARMRMASWEGASDTRLPGHKPRGGHGRKLQRSCPRAHGN
jgi:hypothetical protein